MAYEPTAPEARPSLMGILVNTAEEARNLHAALDQLEKTLTPVKISAPVEADENGDAAKSCTPSIEILTDIMQMVRSAAGRVYCIASDTRL